MSVFAEKDVTCPACGVTERRNIAKSIHGPRVPAVVDAIRSRSFQVFNCGSCEAQYDVAHPCTYVDFDKKHYVALFPSSSVTTATFQQAMVDLAPDAVRQQSAGFTVRCVFGLDGFGDKIACLTEGLDDVALEICKLDLLRFRGLRAGLAYRPRLIGVDGDTLQLRVWTPNKPEPVTTTIERATVHQVATHPDWAAARDALAEGPWVDVGRVMMGAAR